MILPGIEPMMNRAEKAFIPNFPQATLDARSVKRRSYSREDDDVKRIARVLAIAAAAACLSPTAYSQSYPVKPVRVIIPAAAGDSCDVLTRLIGPKLNERLGQPFTVDNRPGASGQLGLMLLTQAVPDGYTLACGQ